MVPATRGTAISLERLARRWAGTPAVTVGAILSGLGSGGFARAILLSALPDGIPGRPLPAPATALGLPIALLAARLTSGALAVLLALALALPIPFGNLPPAWALILLAPAMLRRDGVVMLAALGLGVAALVWNATVVWALLAAGEAALQVPQGWMPEWLAGPPR